MSGGGGSNTTVEKADPWEGVQPFLRQGYSDAGQLYGGTAPQYYPGNTVATMGPIQEAGNASAVDFAATGAPSLYNMGFGALQDILGHPAGASTNQMGSGGGGGSSAAFNTQLKPFTLNPEAQQASLDLMAARDPTKNPAFATAQQLAGMSDPTQLLGYQQMQGLQAASDPTQNVGFGAAQQLMGANDPSQFAGYGAINQLLAAGNAGNNPFFQDTLQASLRPVTQAFNEQILPGIRSNAAAMGQVGSSRQGIAEGLAGARANQQMADIAAQMGNQAYGQGLQAVQAGGALGADFQRLAQQNLLGGGQLGAQITGQQLQGLGQAGALGQQLQGQALGNIATGGGLMSNIYGQGLGAAQGAAGLEFGREAQARQLQAEQARASASMAQSRAQGAAGVAAANRNAQLQAMGMLPMLGQMGLLQSNILGDVGGRYQGQEQALISGDQARWNYEQQQPYNMFQDYMSMIAGAPGGSRSTSQPMTSNPIASGIGGAMTGYTLGTGLGSMMGAGAGAAAGAGAGAAGGAAAGSSFGPYGAIAGGLLGLMGVI